MKSGKGAVRRDMNLTGSFWDIGIVFWAGVLVSFTPCVYPVMPVTASLIAGFNTSGSRWSGFGLSLIYVFGMAVTYCLLATGAVLTGRIFGQFQNNPYLFLVLGNILLIFALMMFDVLPFPKLNFSLKQPVKSKGILTLLLLGALSGLMIGPCTAPVLGTLLLYVGSKQNLWHAVFLLFLFSYGVGASLILVGTFSGLISRLPKSGKWMVRVKQVCGAVLLIIAQYYFIKAGGFFI